MSINSTMGTKQQSIDNKITGTKLIVIFFLKNGIQHSYTFFFSWSTKTACSSLLFSYRIVGSRICASFLSLLVLFLHFRRKTRLIKQASVCVCVCVCVCLCSILVPPNNFQTSYPIDTKFWLHIVSYRNSPTPLIPFLNFENCAREKFLKLIFSPFN